MKNSFGKACVRTIEQILEAQQIGMPDLVKAARLNAEHMPCSFGHGAKLVGEVLTANPDEVELIRKTIIQQWRTFGEATEKGAH